jgi:hypothetical protein
MEGPLVNHIRFSPAELDALSRAWQERDLHKHPPHFFKRALVQALGDRHPELAARIARFGNAALRILGNHLRTPQPLDEQHDFTAEEIAVLAAAGGALLFHARFIQALRRTLVQHFRNDRPDLATKLDRLSLRQFESLCAQVR